MTPLWKPASAATIKGPVFTEEVDTKGTIITEAVTQTFSTGIAPCVDTFRIIEAVTVAVLEHSWRTTTFFNFYVYVKLSYAAFAILHTDFNWFIPVKAGYVHTGF